MESVLLACTLFLSGVALEPPRNNWSVWWSPYETLPSIEGFKIIEGDILVPLIKMRSALKSEDFLWENGTVPYKFDRRMSKRERILIRGAIRVLQRRTCVRFVRRKRNDKSFLRFENKKKICSSPVARVSDLEGPLPVNLHYPECFKRGILLHELLHTVGVVHEHSRPDRNRYIKIHWKNINPIYRFNFKKINESDITTFGLPYDYDSIMHYFKNSFSKNGKPTITARRNPRRVLGQRRLPTYLDFEKVNRMYKCRKHRSHHKRH